MKKKTLWAMISSLSISVLFTSSFISASKDAVKIAPINPSFLEYVEKARIGAVSLYSAEGFRLGEIPAPVDLTHIKGPVNKRTETSYPPVFDLRDIDKLSPVKDQGQCGSCWTFATYGSLESYLIPEGWDFSEQDLNANHGFDPPECAGGNAFMSAAYLARWDGPLAESDVPYPYLSSGFSPQKHVQQVEFLPDRGSPLDNDAVKYFVTTYGAVYLRMTWDSLYYNSSTFSYCYSGSASQNHGVCIVGWDDNYDKNKFNTIPPANGAFIVRNSWGTSWGEGGYFYLSYYDAKLSPVASFNNAEGTNNYSHVYQYDPLGWVTDLGFINTVGWAGNIFTALDNQPVQAVGFYTNDLDVNLTIHIYKNISGSSDPTNGTLASTKASFFTYPGYHTVLLDSPVALTTSEKFSVVIRFENSSYTYPLAVELPLSSYSSNATANPGESFASSNGTNWIDIATSFSNTNACIKAFGMSSCPPAQTPLNPLPADGATGVSPSAILDWSDSSGATSYDVHFGTSPTPPYVATTTSSSWDPPSMAYGMHYYWYIVAINSCGSTTGTIWDFYTQSAVTIPTITTNAVTSITAISAVSGGNVTSDGGASVTARGVCWGTSSSPTTANPHTTDGTGTGTFTSNITGLNPNTHYYVRAYATNSAGTAYGNQQEFTTATWIQIPGNLKSLVAGDFNNDGKDDLAGLNVSGAAYYTTNLGTWSAIPGSMTFSSLVVGDFNNDGVDDLAGLTTGGSVYYTTNLSTWTNIPGTMASLVAGDFNNDGVDDLAGLNAVGSIYYTTNLSTWTHVPGTMASLVAGDFNNNGTDDLAGLNAGGWVYFTTNLSTWTRIPGTIAKLAVGDFNNNGTDDLAGLNAGGWVYFTTNLSTWTRIPGVLDKLVVGDFNNDGKDDLAGLNAGGSIFYTLL
jgi:C1A family cysteine protease